MQLAEAKVEGKAHYTTAQIVSDSARSSTHQTGFNEVLQSLLAQTTETPLTAELGAATELWKVQPDTPGEKVTHESENSWKEVIPVYSFICARCATQKWCDYNKLPELAALPTHLFPRVPPEGLQLHPFHLVRQEKQHF